MKKRTIIIIGAVVIVIGIIVGVLFMRGRSAIQEMMDGLETVEISRGTLMASVGATGTVRANQTAAMAWETSGSVEKINVSLGDEVKKGDILAELDQDSVSQSIILAEADLVAAENALDDLYDAYSELMVAQAEQAVANAEDQLDFYQTQLNNLNSPAPQADVDQAEANLILYENALEQAKEDYEPYENKPDSDVKATYKSRLAQAQKNYDNAVRYLNNLKGTASDIDLSVAQANLKVAQQQFQEAKDNYQDILTGPKDSDVTAAEARVAAARATLEMLYIEAPFDGTVTQAVPKVGDQVSPGLTAFRVDDLSSYLVDVQISEVDINSVYEGQDATLVFDAILDETFNAKVIEVSPVGTNVQGAVNFTVTLEMKDDSGKVKPGMTAAVTIITQEVDDVLLIPNRAVKRNLDGERVVFIIDQNGQFKEIPIQLGSTADIYSEILSGDLKEGDKIILNPPAYLTGSMFTGGSR